MAVAAEIDYDSFLEDNNVFGRYQILIFILLATTSFKKPIDVQVLVIGGFTPTFWCDTQNATVSSLNKSTCTVSPLDEEKCSSWTYDTSVMSRTIVTEFNLVCGSAYLYPLFQTIIFASFGIGRVLDPLSDVIGRRKFLLAILAYDLILTPIQAFVPTFTAQIVFRFLRGLVDNIPVQGLLLILEIVSPKYRLNFSCNYWIFWCIGYAIAGLLGKFLHDWRYIQICTMIVTPCYIAIFFLICESPRWLLVKGRKLEAITALKKICRWNGRVIDDSVFEKIRVETNVQTGRLNDAFKSRTMAMKTLIGWLVMWTFHFSYVGLLLDLTFASNDIFLNIAVMGLIELPASPLSWLVGDRVGRRLTTCILLLVTSLIIIAVPHIPTDSLGWLRLTMAVFGKFSLSMAFCIGATYVTELQPTCVRNVALFPARMLGSVSAVIAPFVLRLNTIAYWIPSAMIGITCLIASFAVNFLPETVNLPLPQTVEEADLLTRGEEMNFKKNLSQLHSRDFELKEKLFQKVAEMSD